MCRLLCLGLLIIDLIFVASAHGQDKLLKDAADLPTGARSILGSDRFRVNGYIGAAAISPDGKEIAIANGSTQISILSAETGRPIRSFLIGEYLRNNQIFYTPDGKRLVTAGYNGIHSWDSVDGKKIITIPPADKDRRDGAISMSDDGSTVSVSTMYQNAFVKVMKLTDGSELGTIKPLHNSTLYTALSPDGLTVATWGQHYGMGVPKPEDLVIPRSVHLWDSKTAKLIASIDTEIPVVSAVRFSPDGKRIATSGMGSIQLWDTATGKLLGRFAGRSISSQQASMVFSSDGKKLSVSSGRGVVQSWETETGKRLGQSQVPISAYANLHLRADGTLLAWGIDHNVLVLWDAISGKLLTPIGGHRSPATRLQFTSDGKQLISLAADGRMIRWDLASGREMDLDRRPSDSPILYSPNGKYFVGSSVESSGAALFESATNQEHFALVGAQGAIDRGAVIAFSPDSKRLVAVPRNNNREMPAAIPIWNVETSVPLPLLKGQKGDFTSAAFSPDGVLLSTCSYSYQNPGGLLAEIWSRDVLTGKVLSKIQIPNQQVLSMAYLDDRLFVAMNMNGPVRIYDALSGREVRDLENTVNNPASSLGVSPDRRLIGMAKSSPVSVRNESGVTEIRYQVIAWESASGTIRRQFEVPSPVASLAFSQDNKTLSVGLGNTTILLFDVDQPAETGPSSKEIGLEDHWKTLEDKSASKGWKAIQAMIAKPDESVSIIKARTVPAENRKPDPAKIAKWIADLDSPRYVVRETAMKELEKVATESREPIRLALEKKSISLEMRERLEKLADTSSKPALETEVLRPLRAIEVLERINTPAAREHLKTLAAGGDSAVTRAARDALTRLEVR